MRKNNKNILLLITVLFIIFLTDRILLWHFGRPLWEWDEKLHYKHRKNITKVWSSFNNKIIKINEYGFRDDSFPVKKKKNELRILNLGDSITMGHGVSSEETYSAYLEKFLADSLHTSVQAINTGVMGYSTFQELEVLKRSLIFDPDIVTIGFCLNDVTEPFIVNKDLGGTGLDYHKVTQAPNKFTSYLLNETGFGRLIQEIRIKSLDAKQEKIAELYNAHLLIDGMRKEKYKKQWEFTLNELSKIYSLCNEKNIKVILLIFPFTFQLNDSSSGRVYEQLIKNADEHKVPVIDYLNVFNELIKSGENPAKYFLDEDHLTPEGHYAAAEELSRVVLGQLKLVGLP